MSVKSNETIMFFMIAYFWKCHNDNDYKNGAFVTW